MPSVSAVRPMLVADLEGEHRDDVGRGGDPHGRVDGAGPGRRSSSTGLIEISATLDQASVSACQELVEEARISADSIGVGSSRSAGSSPDPPSQRSIQALARPRSRSRSISPSSCGDLEA